MEVSETVPSTAPANGDNTPVSTVKTSRQVPVEFTGNAKEFFGIWMVNMLLTIVTLGIYSAWAKVRTMQYFYGNTKIDNHAMSYLAEPLQILKGRILAFALFIVYSLIFQFFPVAGLVLFVVMLFAIPWFLNQSLRFNLRMSSYRNVRFSFQGSYGSAFKYWILLPIASVFTAYLAMPWALKKGDEYVYNNIGYGNKDLESNLDTGQYYETVLWIFVASIGVMMAFGLIVFLMTILGAAIDVEALKGNPLVSLVLSVAVMVLYLFFVSLCGAMYRGRIRNHILNNSIFDGLASFKSDVKIPAYTSLVFTNLLALLCTFGLAYPWIKVRTALFLAQATTIELEDDAEDVLDAMVEEQSAFGEEAAEVFDVDISLA